MYRYEKQLCFIQGSLDVTLRKCRENTRLKINLHKIRHQFIFIINYNIKTEYQGIAHKKNLDDRWKTLFIVKKLFC